MTKTNVVTKSNDLIDARYSLSLQSQKLILACLSKYDSRQGKELSSRITITALEYSQLMNINPKNAHRELYAAADSLFESSVILFEDGKKVKIRWVQEQAEKITGEAAISIIWSDRILKYISQLTANFTSYKLSEVAKLQSVYSVRIYELLMRFKSTGHRVISIDDMRESLGIGDKYASYKSLSKDVIKPAIAELNKNCAFKIDFERVLKGRKTVALSFKFKQKSAIKRKEEQLELDIAGAAEAAFIEEQNEDSLLNHG